MKNIIKLILILLIVMTATGCKSTSKYQNNIFNDENEIIKSGDSFSYKNRLGKSNKESTKIEFTSFTGMDTIYKFIADKDNGVVFDFKSNINKGDFKLVLITPDDEIVNILEDTNEGVETIEIKKGTSRMKLVGNKASGEIEINIDAGENIKVSVVE